ncbi:uncharacterized protein LOC117295655 [Asterias rubens]|uniref:uncharacterized protein LOC117295655 n=1 Tax=Asterias rubens TaxID=7604 RepID=UPI0014550D54|nr:uncharacterized protein LOC117295655 [Asterias rubens]
MSSGEDVEPTQLSWWERQQQYFREDLRTFDIEDCNSCRYISGGTLMLAGLYVTYVGRQRAKHNGSRYGFIPSMVVGSIFGVLGVMRLAKYNPFSSSGKALGIDALDSFKDRVRKMQTEVDLFRKAQQIPIEQLEQMHRKQKVEEDINQKEQEGGAITINKADSNTSKDS